MANFCLESVAGRIVSLVEGRISKGDFSAIWQALIDALMVWLADCEVDQVFNASRRANRRQRAAVFLALRDSMPKARRRLLSEYRDAVLQVAGELSREQFDSLVAEVQAA